MIYSSFQIKREHYEEIMKKLVGNPIHVLSLIHRIINLLPPALASLNSCNVRTEMEFVEESILKDLKVSEADLVGYSLSTGYISTHKQIKFLFSQL